MKVLHTSDWHLGRRLYGKKRYAEFEEFLNWLSHLIATEMVDVLLVAGDIFDTSTPSNRAQELYYRFLCQVAASSCRHVVIIAGNHDSPSFLTAPQQLLKVLNIHVIGEAGDSPDSEVITLHNSDNIPQAIICAVPYLRDKDLRQSEAGESIEDKNAKMIAGLSSHYASVAEIAAARQPQTGNVPLIGMGHLFTAGGKIQADDGVRELYIGSLAHVGVDVFPASFDYLALGHLHVAQKVGKQNHIRYCGSPLPMGFGEATQDKQVITIDFSSDLPDIKEITVPHFQELKRITGDLSEIITQINSLKESDSSAWLEIIYNGKEVAANLRQDIDKSIADSHLEVLSLKNERIMEQILTASHNQETLDDLDTQEVFDRCLNAHDITEAEKIELRLSYQQILIELQEEDVNKE
jgi:DNA repair protein SbcD/Mre11